MPRQFGQNIVIDGRSLSARDTPVYERDVHEILTLLLAFDTGRAVVHEIWAKPRHLRIVPYRSRRNPVNADATPLNDRAATAPHQPVRDGGDGHRNPDWGIGTGQGSNVVVHYSPTVFPDEDVFEWDGTARGNFFWLTGLWPPDPGSDPAEVLLHELVHGLRQMAGRWDCVPMGHRLDTREEFFAVLVANMYSSERGRFRPLRADHGTTALTEPVAWRDSPEFQALIRNLAVTCPGLVNRLFRVKALFNPFAGAYEQHP